MMSIRIQMHTAERILFCLQLRHNSLLMYGSSILASVLLWLLCRYAA